MGAKHGALGWERIHSQHKASWSPVPTHPFTTAQGHAIPHSSTPFMRKLQLQSRVELHKSKAVCESLAFVFYGNKKRHVKT